jgi:hypothetical protein
MKRRFLIASSGILILLLLGLAICALLPNEPVYQSKTLTRWIVQLNTGNWTSQTVPAEEAIRHIGTNAFPKIVQLLRSRDSAFKTKLIRLSSKIPLMHVTSARDKHRQAFAACSALGAMAKPLVPEVAKVLPEAPYFMIWLNNLGPAAEEAVPPLVAILKGKTKGNRVAALQTLVNISQYKRDDVLRALHQCVQDTNDPLRFDAADAIQKLDRAARSEAAMNGRAQ